MMFQVENEEHSLLFLAPPTPLAQILDLSPGAVRRVELETVGGKRCELHFAQPFAGIWKTLYVTRLPMEIPISERNILLRRQAG